MRWDRKKFPEPNLYMYGKDDRKIVVYNMRGSQKKGDRKNTREKN